MGGSRFQPAADTTPRWYRRTITTGGKRTPGIPIGSLTQGSPLVLPCAMPAQGSIGRTRTKNLKDPRRKGSLKFSSFHLQGNSGRQSSRMWGPNCTGLPIFWTWPIRRSLCWPACRGVTIPRRCTGRLNGTCVRGHIGWSPARRWPPEWTPHERRDACRGVACLAGWWPAHSVHPPLRCLRRSQGRVQIGASSGGLCSVKSRPNEGLAVRRIR